MNNLVKSDRYNNIWLFRTQGGRFFVQWREQGNKFTRFRAMTKKDALAAFKDVEENQNFYGITR